METPKKDSGRYIIRCVGTPASLDEVVRDIDADPSMELIDLIGPPSHPHTAVVSMPHTKAASLEQRFRTSTNQFTIEPDRPLSLFGGI